MKHHTSILPLALALVWLALTPGVRGQNLATITTLHSFDGNDGLRANGDLLLGTGGSFYGTTYFGGSNEYYGGTVFQITPAGAFTTLHSFDDSGTEGYSPVGGLAEDVDGNYYGTTYYGGTDESGTVFQITPAGEVTTLHSFSYEGTDGTDVIGGLVRGSNGDFYGMTFDGGANYAGTIFRFAPDGGYGVLHSFTYDDTTSSYPTGSLVQGPDGDFYGLTSGGGAYGNGTVFKVTPGGVVTTLYSFSETGSDYSKGLVLGSDGNFYGALSSGGENGTGTLFKVTPAGALTFLHDFGAVDDKSANRDGAYLYGHLVEGSDGNFYGTANSGGTYGNGTVYRVTPAGVFSTVYTFTATDDGVNADGANPFGSLTLGSDGNFYGTAVNGGANDYGTVFKLVLLPEINSPYSATGAVGRAFSYQITATQSPTSFSAEGLPPGLTLNAQTGLISGTPTIESGFDVTLHATSDHGTGSAPLFLIIRGPLAVTSAATAAATQSESFSYQITANDTVTTYGARGLPQGLTVDPTTGLITGKPFNSGTAAVEVSAGNATATAFTRLTLAITPVLPVFTSANTATATRYQPFHYRLTATNAPTSFAARGLPTGLTLDEEKGYITGYPINTGIAAVKVSATNAAGTVSMRLTFTIGPFPPVITSATMATATVGQAFSYQIEATNTPTYYYAEGLPTGLDFDNYTGLITGTPTDAGKAAVTIYAYNGGGDGSAKLILTINPD